MIKLKFTPYKVSNFNSIPLSKEILFSRKFENAQYFKGYSFWLFLSVCAKCSKKNKIGKSVSAFIIL